jgi:hypothetical protein
MAPAPAKLPHDVPDATASAHADSDNPAMIALLPRRGKVCARRRLRSRHWERKKYAGQEKRLDCATSG